MTTWQANFLVHCCIPEYCVLQIFDNQSSSVKYILMIVAHKHY